MQIERPILGPSRDFAGRRVFIVGSGPSLDDLDLSRLNQSIVFALNASVTLFDLAEAGGLFWFVRDRRAVVECASRLLGPHTLRVIAGKRSWEQVLDFARRQRLSGLVYDERSVVHERTVAEDALQIARRLGAAEAVLVGVDCHAPAGRPYAAALGWKEPHWYRRDDPPKDGAESKACASMLKALRALAKSGKLDGFRVRSCSETCDAFEYVSYAHAVASEDEEAALYQKAEDRREERAKQRGVIRERKRRAARAV